MAKGREKKNKEQKQNIKEKMTELLELPKDVVLNLPKLTVMGANNIIIENYKGIIEYDDNNIRVNTGLGAVRILGENLLIKEITSEDIMVNGNISSLEFLR